jgi:hypothetical protein
MPYLNAMRNLSSLNDTYRGDEARAILHDFLGNAQHWRGEKARRIKDEIRAMLNGKSYIPGDDFRPRPTTRLLDFGYRIRVSLQPIVLVLFGLGLLALLLSRIAGS